MIFYYHNGAKINFEKVVTPPLILIFEELTVHPYKSVGYSLQWEIPKSTQQR